MKAHQLTVVLVISLLLVVLAGDSSGIVIRHDRDDSDYVDLGARFPAAVDILPDGSGALVAPRFVLTAAHVARGIGRRNPSIEIEGVKYDVDRIFIHPDWIDHGPHDIGILRLNVPVSNVPPAAIYRGDDEARLVATLVGCGDTGTGLTGPMDTDRKKRGATNRIDEVDDTWIYFTFEQGDAATNLEGVSGPGDSGGPAFIEKDGRLFVVGVSVFNRGGKPGRYGTQEGYTRVSRYTDWIDAIVSGVSDEPGLVPGDDPEPSQGGSGVGAERVIGPAASDAKLDDVPGGSRVLRYLQAYNSNNDEEFFAIFNKMFSSDYIDSRSKEEHLAFYGRLYEDEFGALKLLDIMTATEQSVVILVAGDRGAKGEFRFMFDADGKITDLLIAKIDARGP